MRVRSLVPFLLCFATVAVAQQLPHPAHVVIVIDENKGFTDIIGSSAAPYINSLPARGALLTNYSGLHHPSQPNYIELFSGNEQGVCTDKCPTPASINKPNLAASLFAKGLTFVGFAENLPTPVICTTTPLQFAQRHCPWLDFAGLPSSSSKDFTVFPTTPAGFAALPTVAMVIPNLADDMHTASTSGGTPKQKQQKQIMQGNAWLKANLDAYAAWAATNNSLLVITWDEDSSSYPKQTGCPGINTPPGNRIVTIILGQHVIPGSTSNTPYTHYNLLRTIENMYGLTPIGNSTATGAQPITGIWN
jgi:acid phosphatase